TYNTAGTETQMSIFTPGITDGSDFTWEVSALVDGVVACTTTRVGITRTPGGGGGDNSGGRPFTPNVCGNGVCEPRNREDRRTCPADC
ncbi:MAG: hypothetical protein K8I30_22780, partial [Anaerolineae bacterium]|nr:hypothetical protein [Anaerolineae bacterium]